MKRSSNDQTLKDILDQFINNPKLKPKLMEVKVVECWNVMMGPNISSYTQKIYLKGHVLHLHIQSAALRQELLYGQEKIKCLLNDHLGEPYITEVVIH